MIQQFTTLINIKIPNPLAEQEVKSNVHFTKQTLTTPSKLTPKKKKSLLFCKTKHELTEISHSGIALFDFIGNTKNRSYLYERRRHDLAVKNRLPEGPRGLRPRDPPLRLLRLISPPAASWWRRHVSWAPIKISEPKHPHFPKKQNEKHQIQDRKTLIKAKF